MLRLGGVAAAVAGVLCVLAGVWVGFATAHPGGLRPPGAEAAGLGTSPHPGFGGLQDQVAQLLHTAGATGGVTLAELGGSGPQTWSYGGDQQFVAASTYKLPLLMEEAENVAAGRWHGGDSLCFEDDDLEDGWFSDYSDGTCMSRTQLAERVGQESDNTAAHILVRATGGPEVLNQYAKSHGARESAFYDPNTTTSNDLAALWVGEASGRAGGRSAQRYLYPMLTHTQFEDGIPAGVSGGATVVHKIGDLSGEINDAGLVAQGPDGPYVLAICTQGTGGEPGWKLVADISRAVWRYEATR